jgi:hypothetical protein
VEFNLQNLGFDTGIAINIQEKRALAVTTADISIEDNEKRQELPDSDIFHETEVHNFLHCNPGLRQRYILELNCLAIRTVPFRRVAFRRVHIFQSNREMDQEKIKVCDGMSEVLKKGPNETRTIEPPGGELDFCQSLDVFFGMECVPQLKIGQSAQLCANLMKYLRGDDWRR